MTIQELREKRAKAWDTARDFLDSKRQADGTLSEEDSKTYDAMEATIVNLGKEIQRMERQAEIEADMAKATSAPILTTPTAQNTEPEKTGTASAAYAASAPAPQGCCSEGSAHLHRRSLRRETTPETPLQRSALKTHQLAR